MSPHFTEVTFTRDEGRCLEVLAALLGRRGRDRLHGPVGDAPVSRALLAAGSDRMARAVARFLTEEGGYRERAFLRGERRVGGRAWDASLGGGFTPVFTVASRDLWLRGARALPALASLDGPAGRRARDRLIEQTVAVAGTRSGDWALYALALDALPGFQLPADDERSLARRLVAGSPLAALLDAAPEAPRAALCEHLAALVAGPEARMVECVETRLAARWIRRAVAHARWQLPQAELCQRWGSLGECLHAWLDVLEAARRTDLARPLLTFAAALPRGVFTADGEALRARVAGVASTRSVDDRERLLAAVGAVVGVGVRLARLRDRLAHERYGDDRYAEGQLYVGEADRILAPARRALESLARALDGGLG